MEALGLLNELAGKRRMSTPRQRLLLIQQLAEESGLLPFPVPLVLITGTCGKGSTTSFLSAILKENGHRVGMIQSPHLISYNERIQFNGNPVPEKRILDKIDQFLAMLSKYSSDASEDRYGALNYGLLFLFIGLHLFIEEKADLVLVESGIGGYNDPCSFFDPILSIITNVFKDHQAVLGNTFEQIAFDKTGVIKQGAPAITGTRILPALQVIEREASWKNSPLFCLGKDFACKQERTGLLYEEDGFQFDYELQVPGDFQRENSALAVKASRVLHQLGFECQEELMRRALGSIVLPARFQIISKQPLTVVDGAHNGEEIRRFCETAGQYQCDTYFMIAGFSGDKNIAEMLEWFKNLNCVYLFAPHSNTARLQDPAALALQVRTAGHESYLFDSLAEAYQFAVEKAKPSDGILFSGSMFIAGDALKLFR